MSNEGTQEKEGRPALWATCAPRALACLHQELLDRLRSLASSLAPPCSLQPSGACSHGHSHMPHRALAHLDRVLVWVGEGEG